MEWFYSGLGGIYQNDNSVAYSNIVIAPKPVGDITWVTCSYNSAKGMISSDWEIVDDRLRLKVQIPESASASIVIPEGYQYSSCEVIDISTNKSIDFEMSNDTFNVTAGNYQVIVTKSR